MGDFFQKIFLVGNVGAMHTSIKQSFTTLNLGKWILTYTIFLPHKKTEKFVYIKMILVPTVKSEATEKHGVPWTPRVLYIGQKSDTFRLC